MRYFLFILVLFPVSIIAQGFVGLSSIVDQQKDINYIVKLGEKKAFPTAIGAGKYTEGNTTSTVYTVTNLNGTVSEGALGSLANAKNMSDVTIQFDVAGEIDFSKQTCSFSGDNITFAFETAPAPGITLKFGTISINGGSEVIMRHYRGRRGYGDKYTENGLKPLKILTVSGKNQNNIIIDHCSLSWTMDENTAIGDQTAVMISNFTYQNNLNAEAINRYGFLVNRGGVGLSFLRNAFIHVADRVIESTHGENNPEWELINNIIYDYDRPTTASYGSFANSINNIYKAGPVEPIREPLRYHNGESSALQGDGAVFDSGNLYLGVNTNGTENDKWLESKAASRLNPSSYMPIPASELEDEILYDVGATAFQDSVRTRLINEYLTNTGTKVISNESDVGGFPVIGSAVHDAGYWAAGNRVSQAFKDAHGFSDDMEKPDFFTVNGITFDNREYSGGTYVKDGVTVYEYQGGTLTGNNLYTWWDIFRFELANDFETYKWD